MSLNDLNWMLYFLLLLAGVMIVGVTVSILLLKSLFRSSDEPYSIEMEKDLLSHPFNDENNLPSIGLHPNEDVTQKNSLMHKENELA